MLLSFSPRRAHSAGRPASHNDPMESLAESRSEIVVLVARILRRTKNDPDVQDCTNETMRRALEHGGALRPDQAFRPWLFGIARHVALDALRAEYRRRERHLTMPRSATFGSAETEFVVGLADRSAGPEALAAERERARRLELALERLPSQQREALLLFHVEELGYREIAELLGVPVGTVGTWVLRGRQGLAAELGEEMEGRWNASRRDGRE